MAEEEKAHQGQAHHRLLVACCHLLCFLIIIFDLSPPPSSSDRSIDLYESKWAWGNDGGFIVVESEKADRRLFFFVVFCVLNLESPCMRGCMQLSLTLNKFCADACNAFANSAWPIEHFFCQFNNSLILLYEQTCTYILRKIVSRSYKVFRKTHVN